MQLYAVFGAPCDSKAVVALYFERAGSWWSICQDWDRLMPLM
jgi:hypothetical protein